MQGDSEELNLESSVIDQEEIDHTLSTTVKQIGNEVKQTLSVAKKVMLNMKNNIATSGTDFNKNLYADVKKRQSILTTEQKNEALLRQYIRPFTFQRREKLSATNRDDFVNYVAREENNKIEQLKHTKDLSKSYSSVVKAIKEVQKELLKVEKQKLVAAKKQAREEQAIKRKIIGAERRVFDTGFKTAKNLIVGGAMSAVGITKQTANMFDPYARANKYGLLVNRNSKFDNTMIARARFSPYISQDEVSGELANYYEKQWHFKTRKQEINPHLHRLNLSSEANVEQVINTINKKFQGNDDRTQMLRRQMARDVGLEATYIASLEKKITGEEQYVREMEQAKTALLELQGSVKDIVAQTLPSVVKAINFAKDKLFKTPESAVKTVATAVTAPTLMKAGAKYGVLAGGTLGSVAGPVGTVAGGAIGGLVGMGAGALAAYGIGNGIANKLTGLNNDDTQLREHYKVNAELPTMREVASRTGNNNVTINFNGAVYNPNEITDLITNTTQNILDNNTTQKSIFYQTP